MSLLIAGYEYTDNSFFGGGGSPEVTGAFILADSAITSGNKTLLNEFRKVYRLEARLYKPTFRDDQFDGYRNVHQRDAVILGFAGNTLTSQHIFNHVEAHLSDLYISCSEIDSAHYLVKMPCEKDNPLLKPMSRWDEGLFLDRDFDGLVTGDFIAGVIAHAIQGALSSAKQYKLTEADFDTLKTEWVAGLYCRVTQEHKLYRFDATWTTDADGVISSDPTMTTTLIPHDKVTTLGLPGFEPAAQAIVDRAFQALRSPQDELRAFLSQTIQDVQKSGPRYIDFPMFEMTVQGGKTGASRMNMP